MQRSSSLQNKLWIYYQCILAISAVFVFFTDLDVYLIRVKIGPEPKLLVAAFILGSIPLLKNFFSRLKHFSFPLIIWCVGYIGTSSFYLLFAFPHETVFQELETRILSIIFLLTMLLIFSQHTIVENCAKYAIVAVSFLNVFNHIYEFFNPRIFGALNDSGRPAGFYIDPNKAGCALVLSLIFGVGVLPSKYRVPFVLVIGFGVFLTFSRSAILCWIIIVVILFVNDILPRRQSLFWALVIGIILLCIGTLGITFIDIYDLQERGILNENIMSRLAWFLDPSSRDAYDNSSRFDIVEFGWQRFVEHPFLGNGIGSTRTWSKDISTHNMYLFFMIDHGFIGALFLPLVVYAVVRKAKEDTKYLAFVYAIFILFWGLFSHNVMEQRFILLTFSLMATMTRNSQAIVD